MLLKRSALSIERLRALVAKDQASEEAKKADQARATEAEAAEARAKEEAEAARKAKDDAEARRWADAKAQADAEARAEAASHTKSKVGAGRIAGVDGRRRRRRGSVRLPRQQERPAVHRRRDGAPEDDLRVAEQDPGADRETSATARPCWRRSRPSSSSFAGRLRSRRRSSSLPRRTAPRPAHLLNVNPTRHGKRWVLAAAVMPLVGCTLLFKSYNECDKTADCATRGSNFVCQSSYCIPLPEGCHYLGAQDGDAVTFGLLMPQTNKDGSVHAWGPTWEKLVDLVATQINPPNQTGVGGTPVRFISCNTGSDTIKAAALASFMITDAGVSAIIGDGSGETLAELAVTVPANVLLMTGAATSPALTSAKKTLTADGGVPLLWRTTPSDALQAPVIAKVLLGQIDAGASVGVFSPDGGVPFVAVFERNDSYGQGLVDSFKAIYPSGFATAPCLFTPSGDVTSAVSMCSGFTPDVVLAIGFADDVSNLINKSASFPQLSSAPRWFFTQGGLSNTNLQGVEHGSARPRHRLRSGRGRFDVARVLESLFAVPAHVQRPPPENSVVDVAKRVRRRDAAHGRRRSRERDRAAHRHPPGDAADASVVGGCGHHDSADLLELHEARIRADDGPRSEHRRSVGQPRLRQRGRRGPPPASRCGPSSTGDSRR